MIEDHVMDLLNFEKSANYNERQKAALAYAEAIIWHLNTDDAFWDRMHRHFSEPELVELGCMIGLTLGQQSWLRLLNIEHHAGDGGNFGVDGARLRGCEAAGGDESRAGLLGEVENQGAVRQRSLAERLQPRRWRRDRCGGAKTAFW